ncbi:MAG TPA: hypothetical protein VHZ96_19160 [Frankiaceae bacterium]|nr:hypothetical protein [Frankiaceae bacterium]
MNAETTASLATAAGTLVLAVATFASVRSANRAARTAERSLLEGLRPVLVNSRLQDPAEKISFVDQHFIRLDGGHGVVEVTDEVIYLAIALRNVGRGMGVLHGWLATGVDNPGSEVECDPRKYRILSRDIYVPAGDFGFWQGAIRDPSDPLFDALKQAASDRTRITIDLLYGDHEGGQRTVSRFSLLARESDDGALSWFATVSRHRHLDGADPR